MRWKSSDDVVSDPARSAGRVLICGRVLAVLCTLAIVGLLVRVVQLQTDPPQQIVQRIDTQRNRSMMQGRRGLITDRTGRVMAVSRLATRLFADPKHIKDPTSFAHVVGGLLDYDPGAIEQRIRPRMHKRYVVLDHQLTEARLVELGRLKVPGLMSQRWLERDYPQGVLAGQVLGGVGFEGAGRATFGRAGIEAAYEKQLAGRGGEMAYQCDVNDNPLHIEAESYRPPTDGRAIRLTIDLTIQSIAEDQLAQRCRQFNARHGQMVVMDPVTGQILAMANYPPYNPADLRKSKADDLRNRCVTDVFEPGSVFKPFVWAAALQSRMVRPTETINCTTAGRWVSPRGRAIRDVRGHGRITGEQVLIKSSNIGMAQIGLRMQTNRLYAAVRSYGFGSPTGCSLPGESPGIVHKPKKWTHFSVTSVPMGQEVAANALQIVRALGVIANDGMLVQPIIRMDRSPAATAAYAGGGDDDQQPKRVLRADVARRTRQVMRRVVTEGTGRKANSELFTIFGKTGTAQVAASDRRGYLPDQYVSSFIGGAPVDRPRIVVGCFIHRPDKSIGYYGGIVSAPAVRQVIEQVLIYLGQTPDVPSDDSLTASAGLGSARGR